MRGLKLLLLVDDREARRGANEVNPDEGIETPSATELHNTLQVRMK